MEIKLVTRILNFDFSSRNAKSKYRVKYGDADTFDILRVICNYDGISKLFETASSNFSMGKDSIYSLAVKEDDTFVINWCGNVAEFMK